MAANCEYTTRYHEHTTCFDVRPARLPLANLIIVCALTFFFGTPMLVKLAGDVGVLLSFGLMTFLIWKFIRSKRRIEIIVSATGLSWKARSIAMVDIAEVSCVGREGVTVGAASFAAVGQGVVGAGVVAGAAIAHASGRVMAHAIAIFGNRLTAREFKLRVRRRSHSTPLVLIPNLTQETGLALMEDIALELQRRSQPDPCVPALDSNGFGVPARGGATAYGGLAPQNRRAYVYFTAGPLQGQSFWVTDSTLIGRDSSLATLAVSHPQVSSAHAWMGLRNGLFVFVDRGSTNGSKINGARVQPGWEVAIQAGDTIVLGEMDEVAFVFGIHAS